MLLWIAFFVVMSRGGGGENDEPKVAHQPSQERVTAGCPPGGEKANGCEFVDKITLRSQYLALMILTSIPHAC